MKHKRSEAGFSLLLIMILLSVLLIIGASGLYIVHRYEQARNDQANSANNLIPGAIEVTFRDGTTYQQILDLVTSYHLTLDPQADYEEQFTPHSYRAVPADQFAAIQAKLKSYPEVVSFIDDSADPSNNRAGAGQKWVKVTYTEETTCSRIKVITTDSGLGAPTQPCPTNTKTIFLTVPKGQEDSFVAKFKRNASVESATRLSQLVAQ